MHDQGFNGPGIVPSRISLFEQENAYDNQNDSIKQCSQDLQAFVSKCLSWIGVTPTYNGGQIGNEGGKSIGQVVQGIRKQSKAAGKDTTGNFHNGNHHVEQGGSQQVVFIHRVMVLPFAIMGMPGFCHLK